jgi:hypothetical protein
MTTMQWHLGTLRNESEKDCYPAANQSSTKPDCLPGYVGWGNGEQALCCQGNDGHLMLNHPLHHGFDEFVATPQVGNRRSSPRFILKMLILPRQARDTHRKSTQKSAAFSCSARPPLPPTAAASGRRAPRPQTTASAWSAITTAPARPATTTWNAASTCSGQY